MTVNEQTTVTLFCGDRRGETRMPDKLADAITWLLGFLEQVPEEYRRQATIELDSDDDGWSMEISYSRPSTDSEKQERVNEERRWAEEREARERQLYDRLMAKFEGSHK